MKLTIGENISFFLNCRNMTEGQLSNRMGVPAEMVSRWEAGESLPHLYYLINLADIFEITLDELIRTDMKQNKNTK